MNGIMLHAILYSKGGYEEGNTERYTGHLVELAMYG